MIENKDIGLKKESKKCDAYHGWENFDINFSRGSP